MELKLKRIKETSKYLISDKYVHDKNGEVIDVKVKPGLLKMEKGSVKGINGEQIVLDMSIKPIKFVEGETMTLRYLRKVISIITKHYDETGKYVEEGTFFTNHIGSIFLQGLEDGNIILGELTRGKF